LPKDGPTASESLACYFCQAVQSGLLDDAAFSGEAAAFRVASLIAIPAPQSLLDNKEQLIVTLARAARQGETAWQTEYWECVLQPAVSDYCIAEVLAVKQVPDTTGKGHRWAGIEAAIEGMWYVAGPLMGLQGEFRKWCSGRVGNRWAGNRAFLPPRLLPLLPKAATTVKFMSNTLICC